MNEYKLDQYFAELRRIEEHRTQSAEKEIRFTYKKILEELRGFLGNRYAQLAKDDVLVYADLQKYGGYARFLEEVEARLSGISSQISEEIKSLTKEVYATGYQGMVVAVEEAVSNNGIPIEDTFAGMRGVTPQIIKNAVENPVAGLTLKDTLEKNRREIIYSVKQTIGVALTQGDRYTTMAKRISECLDADYKKSIRIARTEAHRVTEAGHHDAAKSANDALYQSGVEMVKTWKTMKDGRVRPSHAKGKAQKYNHKKMDGVTIPIDDEFILPSGAKTMAPGQSGIAGEDINCRCYLSYALKPMAKGKGLSAGPGEKDDQIKRQKPKVLETIDFNDKTLVKSKLIECEKTIADDSIENAIVVTKKGKVIQCFGSKNGVNPDSDLGDALIGSYMTHNHPIGSNNEYSFSTLDLELFMGKELEVLRGIDEKYIYEFTRAGGVDEIVSLDQMIEGEDYQHNQIIMQCKKYGIGYRRRKRD